MSRSRSLKLLPPIGPEAQPLDAVAVLEPMILLYEFVKTLQQNINQVGGLGTRGSWLHTLREALLRLQMAQSSQDKLEILVETLLSEGCAQKRLVDLYDQTVQRSQSVGSLDVPWLATNGRLKFCFWGDGIYPEEWKNFDDSPLAFSYLGEPLWNRRQGISVVGSREPHVLSQQWLKTELRNFIADRKAAGFYTISGGARGVDQWAHKISLLTGVPTLAILPSGLWRPYPDSMRILADEILQEGGCLLSEYALIQEMRKFHFRERNRLISSLGAATLVVEAQTKSGSLMTGHLALEQGRPLYVVPGHPSLSAFGGSLELLRMGAACAASSEDLLNFWRCDASELKSLCSLP